MKKISALSIKTFLIAIFIGVTFLGAPAFGEGIVDPSLMPGPLKEVRIDQKLGAQLPLDTEFTDEDGNTVKLGDFYGEKPVILAFVYYKCPMLCTLVLNGAAKSLGVLEFDVGNEFDVIAISFAPDEGPEHATERKAATITRYGREATAEGWHFLTGSEESIQAVTNAAGFQYAYLEDSDEYAHASAIIVSTPEGKLAQYFYGLEYPPKDIRLALVEASENKIGNVVDQLLLYCFRYDPQTGKYTAMTMRILRIVGAIFSLSIMTFLWIMWRRERAAAAQPTPGAA